MGWDGIFKKIFVPWDGTMFKIFRPIPSHGTEFSEKRPMGWDGMGWDGMGWDYPIPRGALVDEKFCHKNKRKFYMNILHLQLFYIGV